MDLGGFRRWRGVREISRRVTRARGRSYGAGVGTGLLLSGLLGVAGFCSADRSVRELGRGRSASVSTVVTTSFLEPAPGAPSADVAVGGSEAPSAAVRDIPEIDALMARALRSQKTPGAVIV